MGFIAELFGRAPFGPLVEHAKKAHECVRRLKPLTEAFIREDYEEVHRLQDEISRLEYEADRTKQEIREHLPRRVSLPVAREDFHDLLHRQDRVADRAEDLAVILILRQTKLHPDLIEEFRQFVDQVLKVGETLMAAAEQLETLAAASFGGAEARLVLEKLSGLNEEEWKADRMQRRLAQHIYRLEEQLDPVTILFYDKMLGALSAIADAAENTGESIRQMIVKK
jgi:hypothetical protein